MGPECEEPSDSDVDFYIIQLGGEGTVRATGIPDHPHCHLLLSVGLNVAADKGPQKVCTHQPSLL
jgi:hypothetical protein